jgi:hypothetical protein
MRERIVWCDAAGCGWERRAETRKIANELAAEHEKKGAPHRCFITMETYPPRRVEPAGVRQ